MLCRGQCSQCDVHDLLLIFVIEYIYHYCIIDYDLCSIYIKSCSCAINIAGIKSIYRLLIYQIRTTVLANSVGAIPHENLSHVVSHNTLSCITIILRFSEKQEFINPLPHRDAF